MAKYIRGNIIWEITGNQGENTNLARKTNKKRKKQYLKLVKVSGKYGAQDWIYLCSHNQGFWGLDAAKKQ